MTLLDILVNFNLTPAPELELIYAVRRLELSYVQNFHENIKILRNLLAQWEIVKN